MEYEIYQLKKKRTDHIFMSWDFAKEHGFNFNDYYLVGRILNRRIWRNGNRN